MLLSPSKHYLVYHAFSSVLLSFYNAYMCLKIIFLLYRKILMLIMIHLER